MPKVDLGKVNPLSPWLNVIATAGLEVTESSQNWESAVKDGFLYQIIPLECPSA